MATVTGGGLIGRALNRIGNAIGDPQVRVGFLENATYPDGKPVAMVAAIQEFGAPNARFPIPPRPFFRTMIRNNRDNWPRQMAALLRANNMNGKKALGLMGEEIAGMLRESIIATNQPALSAVTVMLRSMRQRNPNLKITRRIVYRAIAAVQAGQQPKAGTSIKPLVDTGVMLQSVDYEVTTRVNRGAADGQLQVTQRLP